MYYDAKRTHGPRNLGHGLDCALKLNKFRSLPR